MRYKVVVREYSMLAGWYDVNYFVLENNEELVNLYLRLTQGNPNSEEADREKWIRKKIADGISSFKWSKNDNRSYRVDPLEG